jgi:hypothetical protein
MTKNTNWPAIFGPIAAIVFIALLALGIRWLDRDTKAAWVRTLAQVEKDNTYNLKHPTIVGTNEAGEVIKCYTIRYGAYHNHFIYEVGDTKTTNIPFGKGSLNVIVEKR